MATIDNPAFLQTIGVLERLKSCSEASDHVHIDRTIELIRDMFLAVSERVESPDVTESGQDYSQARAGLMEALCDLAKRSASVAEVRAAITAFFELHPEYRPKTVRPVPTTLNLTDNIVRSPGNWTVLFHPSSTLIELDANDDQEFPGQQPPNLQKS